MLRAPFTSRIFGKKVSFAFSNDTREDLEYIAKLMESGILRAVIDRHFPLEEVAEAHRYVETGDKIGHVVIHIVS